MEGLQQLAVVGCVLGTLAIALWVLHRRGFVRLNASNGRNRLNRKLEVIERLQLSPQHALVLVRVESRTLLIGTSPSGCSIFPNEERHE